MPTRRKLLSIGHSYVVGLNRRLVSEIARIAEEKWEVTAIAPSFVHAKLRSTALEPKSHEEIYKLESVPIYLSRSIHFMMYGRELGQILQQDWDVVHCWEEPYILAGGQIAWWTSEKSKLVYSTFQNYSKQYPPPFNWIESYSMRRATGWIGFGQMVIEALNNRPGYSLPMRLIPPGVDVNHFYPNEKAALETCRSLGWEEKGPPVIGFLGRLIPEKGLNLLMQVLDKLETPWRAIFVGTGPMQSSLEAWAERYPGKVRICNNVQHNDVPQYLNAMDILCAPSQTMPNWREQFGRMLVEAFACGIPVIGSDSGEIPYVIQDAGIVVGEKDELGWVRAISKLLESPSLRQELAAKGLEISRSIYAWPIVARQHLEFFTEILESPQKYNTNQKEHS